MTLKDAYATLKVDKKKRTVVLEELQKLNLEKITAGIHAAEGNQVVSDSGFKLIDVAVQNEFGNSWTLQKTARFFKNGKWWAIKKGTTINIPATKFVAPVSCIPFSIYARTTSLLFAGLPAPPKCGRKDTVYIRHPIIISAIITATTV